MPWTQFQTESAQRLAEAIAETTPRGLNAVALLTSGSEVTEGAVKLARQHFGAWKKPAEPRPATSGFTGTAWADPVTVVDMPGAGQAGVVLVLPAMPANSPERTAASVTNAVLGRGYSSRLNQEIRIKRGLSYGASSGLDLRREAGGLHVSVLTKNASAGEVLGRYAAEHKRPLELGSLPKDCELIEGDFWQDEIARHGRRRLAAAVWLALGKRLL